MARVQVRERLPALGSPEFNRLPPEGRRKVARIHREKQGDAMDARNAQRVAERDRQNSELVEDSAKFIAGEAIDIDAPSRYSSADVMYGYAKQIGDGVCEQLGINKATLRKLARKGGRTR